MRRLKSRKMILEEPQINLTSLIDVVFVILIMFIVVAPLLEMDRIDLATGPSLEVENVHSVQEKSPITIHVYANDSLIFNQQPVTLNELEKCLILAKKRYPNGRPQVFHDKKASFGTYQSIKNAVESAGFIQMDVILKPK
jgi:biopolymer transport protein ExbD